MRRLPLLLTTAVALSALAVPAAAQRAPGRRGPRGEAGERPPAAPRPAADLPARRVDLRVTREGFEPARIVLRKGERTQLVVTRTTDETCAKVLVIDEFLVWDALPLNSAVTITFTPGATGEFPYTCPGGALRGVLDVRNELPAGPGSDGGAR